MSCYIWGGGEWYFAYNEKRKEKLLLNHINKTVSVYRLMRSRVFHQNDSFSIAHEKREVDRLRLYILYCIYYNVSNGCFS